jgi:hypothetical protein
MAKGPVQVATARGLIGGIIYWAMMLLALFGLISTLMSVALFEGDERLWGTLGWAGFTIATYVLGRLAGLLLSR